MPGRSITTKFLMSVLIATSLFLAMMQHPAAQEQVPPAEAGMGKDRLEDLLRTIEDPTAREQFAERLRTLIAAQERAADVTPSVEDLGIDLVELVDDRGMQPAENIVPLARVEAVERWAPGVVTAVDSASARLTTSDLRAMNLRVAKGDPVEAVASDFLSEKGLLGSS